MLAALDSDPHAGLFEDLVDGDVRVGDFALVHERLAEVHERRANRLGHVRYRVAYVADRPRDEIDEEWRPAADVHTLFARAQVEGWFADFLAALPPEHRARHERRGLASFAAEAWEHGLRDEVLEQLRADA